MIETVLVLPTPRALLPPTSRADPVADLRAACDDAIGDLLAGSPTAIAVLAAPVGPPTSSAASPTRSGSASPGTCSHAT